MCGIAGVLHLDGAPASRVALRAMAEAIAHRGPDGEGLFAEGPLGLAHRRLAIIDPSPAGHQPMATPDGRLVLVYNGEVYNYRELRVELEARGHAFRSQTDTEVVLAALAEWGTGALPRFDGMFALALWDRAARRLLLARDRYGVKPLYWARVGDAVLFASEVKAFLRHPGFEVRVSAPHLLEYFTFQNLLTDGTLFAGVRLLPAGQHLSVALDGTTTGGTFWDFAFEEPAPDRAPSPEEAEEELVRRFRTAVERQLVSDRPLGCYLSGGVDSGSVTAVASGALPHLTTFTGGFDLTSASGLELGFDERARSEALSYRFRTEHYEVVLKAGDMERCLPDLVWHLEDLRVGQCYPNFYVARLASKFVKSVLSGIGGDELFAGYPWRYYRALGAGGFDDYARRYYEFWHRLVPAHELPALFQPAVWREVSEVDPVAIFRQVLAARDAQPPRTPAEYVNRSLYFEAKAFLHGLLVVEDKLSMAHGLETRVPFLDNDLVDFAQRLPVALKLRDLTAGQRLDENEPGAKPLRYYQRTRDGKLLLRRAMTRYVPDEVAQQEKQGFSGPDASWFKGESIEYVRRLLWDDRARLYDYLRPDTVRRLVDDHLSGRENRRLFIWSLVCFEWWLRRFLGTSA